MTRREEPIGAWGAFGRRLRYWRRRNSFTQSQLGARLGYHHSVVSRVEAGRRVPPAAFAAAADGALAAAGELVLAWQRAAARDGGPDVDDAVEPWLSPAAAAVFPLADPEPPRPLSAGVTDWPRRLPQPGTSCPLHGDVRCALPAPAVAAARVDALPPYTAAPDLRDAELVHALTALAAVYYRGPDGPPTDRFLPAAEELFTAVHGWALRAEGEQLRLLRRTAAMFALACGATRLRGGQSGRALGWLTAGLRAATAAPAPTLHVALLEEMCTLGCYERDAGLTLAAAGAIHAVGDSRPWVGIAAQLYAARGYALAGRRADSERRFAALGRLLPLVGEPDRDAVTWLDADAGAALLRASRGGALRDVAVATGDRRAGRAAVTATRAALARADVPAGRLGAMVRVRLADAYGCAGELDAAVDAVRGLLPLALAEPRGLLSRELQGVALRLYAAGAPAAELADWLRLA